MPELDTSRCVTDKERGNHVGAALRRSTSATLEASRSAICNQIRRSVLGCAALWFLVAAEPAPSQTLVVANAGQTVNQGDTLSINAIPNMPNLVLSVNGGTSCDTFSYQIDVEYSDQAGHTTQASYALVDAPGDTSSTVDWLGVFEGGDATITWAFNDVQQSTSLSFFISGTNPSNSAVDAYLSSGGAPWFARNMVAWESGAYKYAPYNQYHQFVAVAYDPVWGSPDGIGLMQLEPPARASFDQDYWSWPANIADGVSWLYNQKRAPAYNSWNNELQQMQSDMAPGVRYPPDTEYAFCYFSYPQNGNDTYADGDWIHFYNGDYFIFWNHSTLSWSIDTTGYVSKVCNSPTL